MPASEFWSLSVKEWVCALDGFIEFNSPPNPNAFQPWTEEETAEFEAFKRKIEIKEALNGC